MPSSGIVPDHTLLSLRVGGIPGEASKQVAANNDFTGRLRGDCLNQNWFTTINEAKDIIEE